MNTNCSYCHKESVHGFKYCPHCGAPKIPSNRGEDLLTKVFRPFLKLDWLWKVSTESGENDGMRSSLLGIYEGNVVELARRLARFTYNTLKFEAVDPEQYRLTEPPEPPIGVHVHFAEHSNLYGHHFSSPEDRLAVLREIFKESPVRIEPSPFDRSFYIRFQEDKE